jgi:hypothetical protein
MQNGGNFHFDLILESYLRKAGTAKPGCRNGHLPKKRPNPATPDGLPEL